MQAPRLYCALCAAPFDFTTRHHTLPHPCRWLLDMCVMGRVSFTESMSIEGAPADFPVYVTGHAMHPLRRRTNPLTIPHTKGIKNIFKPKSRKPSGWTAYEPRGSPASVIYPIHRMCLKVLAQFLGESGEEFEEPFAQIQASPQMTRFYERICRASVSSWENPANFSRQCRLWRDHQYFGAAQFGWPRRWIVMADFEYLLCDPVDVERLTEWILLVLLTSEYENNEEKMRNLLLFIADGNSETKTDQLILTSTDGKDEEETTYLPLRESAGGQDPYGWQAHRLSQLPKEILNIIVSYIPPRDVLALCRVDRYLYTTTEMNSAYWRRFLAEGAIPWLWELGTEGIDSVCARLRPGKESIAKEMDWHKACQLLCQPVFDSKEEMRSLLRTPNIRQTGQYGDSQWQRESDSHARGVMDLASLGVWNRRRIWECCSDIWQDKTLAADSSQSCKVEMLSWANWQRRCWTRAKHNRIWVRSSSARGGRSSDYGESVGEFWASIEE